MDVGSYAKGAACIAAAVAMGVGSIGPALGQGMVGKAACENIGKYPESARDIRTTMFLAMGIIESSAIYAFMVAGAIIYAVIF